MIDKADVPINLYWMVALTMAKEHPGTRKSTFYTSASEKKMMDILLQRDLLRMDHVTSKDTAIQITPLGEEALEMFWSLVDMWGIFDSVMEAYLQDRITYYMDRFEVRNISAKAATYVKRGVIMPKPKKKKNMTPPEVCTKGINVKDLEIRDGEYILPEVDKD